MHRSIMEEQQMTNTITLKLTFEELEQIDKYIELNDDTRQLFDKIRSAYPKSPVEEAYKDWWGEYPGTENWTSDATRWQGFQAGYEFAYAISTAKEVMEKVQEEQEDNEWKSVALRFGEKLSGYLSDGYYELSPNAWFRWAVFTYGKHQQIKDAVRESVKWCEENPDKDPLDWLKPQTPEQVADGLKEAFREAVKQGCDILDAVEEWLPDEHYSDGEDYDLGFNDCLNKIKGKLR